jgi:hypothetical protein
MGEVQTDRTNRSLRRLWWRGSAWIIVLTGLSLIAGELSEHVAWPWVKPNPLWAMAGTGLIAHFTCYENDVRVDILNELSWNLHHTALMPDMTNPNYVYGDLIYHFGVMFPVDESGTFFRTRYEGERNLSLTVTEGRGILYDDAMRNGEVIQRIRSALSEAMCDVDFCRRYSDSPLHPDGIVTSRNWWLVFLNGLPFVVLGRLGCVGVRLGRRIVIRPRRRHRGLCMTCGYDIHQLDTATCPECGTAFDPAAYAERAL